jgi:hypothetical protein
MPAVEKGKDHHEGEGAAEAVRQADTRIGYVVNNIQSHHL